MSEDLVVLREILQRELETINAYEKMLERVSDPALREIIDHVTDEEREHVAEMYHLIMDRDPKQRLRSTESLAPMSVSPRDPVPPPPPVFPDGAWSVGALKRSAT